MTALDYQICPVQMGGVVTAVEKDDVKINLNGRLGVLHIAPQYLSSQNHTAPGDAVTFYFSYIQTVVKPLDYDYTPLHSGSDDGPCLVGGTLEEVNDTAVKVVVGSHIGTIAVPRRWVFTDSPLAVGQAAEFYLSRIYITTRES